MSFDRIKGGFKVVNGSRTVQQQFNGQPMTGSNEESTKDLQELRIIQTNLVFLNGLDIKQSKEEILKKKAYMGQYGNIKKVIVKTEGNRDSNSVGVYISFSHPQEASIAILALDQFEFDNKILRAFYGSTKYCNSFLNGTICGKKECPYLHEKAKDYTFNKVIHSQASYDEKFYINYKEIALKVVTSKISFFNNYTATQNPIFPDVAEIIKQARAELASSQPNNALKIIEGNKNSSLMISNMPICTWDEDFSEKSELNNQLSSLQQDAFGFQKSLKDVKTNSSPISETANSKAIEAYNFLQSQQNKDSNLMEQIISKIEKHQQQQSQQQFPIDLVQYQQSQGIDPQNRFIPSSQQNFISTIPSILQAPWNRNPSKIFGGLSATRFVPINWGPVGCKAYRQKYFTAPKLMLENEEEEDQEFDVLNQKINETIKLHALNYPAWPYTFSELAKFFVENYSSLHFKISEYVFGEIWPSETIENLIFTIDERNIIAYQVSEAFDQQSLALYFPTNIYEHFIDRKEQFEEIEQVFASFPNKIIRQESSLQRKRSSNSLQADPQQATLPLLEMKEEGNQEIHSLSKTIVPTDKTKKEKKAIITTQELQQLKPRDNPKQQKQHNQIITNAAIPNQRDEQNVMDKFELQKDTEDKFESIFIQAKGTNNHKKANKEDSMTDQGKKQKKKEVINRFALLEDEENEEDPNSNRKQKSEENDRKEQVHKVKADNLGESSKLKEKIDNKSQVASAQQLNLFKKKERQNKKKEKNSVTTVATVDENESSLSKKVSKEKQEQSTEQHQNQKQNKGDEQVDEKSNNIQIARETQSSKSQQQEKKKKNKQNTNQTEELSKTPSVNPSGNGVKHQNDQNNGVESINQQQNEAVSANEPEMDKDSRQIESISTTAVDDELDTNVHHQKESVSEKNDSIMKEKIVTEKKQSEVLTKPKKTNKKSSVANSKKGQQTSQLSEQQQRKEQLLFLKQEQEKSKQLLKVQNSQSAQQPTKQNKSQKQQQQSKQGVAQSDSIQQPKQQEVKQAEQKIEKKQDPQKQAHQALMEQFFDKSQSKHALAAFKQQVAKALMTSIDPTRKESELEIQEDCKEGKKEKNKDEATDDDDDKSNKNQEKDDTNKMKDPVSFEEQIKQENTQQDTIKESEEIKNTEIPAQINENQNIKSLNQQTQQLQESECIQEERQQQQQRQLQQEQEQMILSQESDDSLDITNSSNIEDKGEEDNDEDGQGQNGQLKISHRGRSKNLTARLLPTNEMFLASPLPSHQYNQNEIKY